jgi:hypothetical protein
MGFLDRILGGGIEGGSKGERKNEVRLSELSDWVKERKDAQGKKVLEEAKGRLREIEECFTDVSYQLDGIAEKKPHETIHERFKKIIANSKPKYLKDMREITSGASPSGIDDYEKLLEYSRRLGESLKELAKVNVGEGRYLTLAYGDEMEAIQKKAKLIQDELGKINQILKSDGVTSKLDVIEEKTKRLKDALAEAGDASSTARACKARIKELEARRGRNAAEIREVEEGEEMKALEEEKKLLEEKKKERERLEETVHSTIRSLDRALKRYKRDCPDELSSHLEELLKNPVGCYFNTPHESTEMLLDKLLRATSSGAVEVKDAGKTAEKIGEAKKKLGSKIKEEYARLEAETASLSEDVSKSGVPGRLNALYGEKSLIESELNSSLKGKEKASARENTMRAEKEALKRELGEFLATEFDVRLSSDD